MKSFPILSYRTFPYDKVSNAPVVTDTRGNRSGKRKKTYRNLLFAFDIETTRLADIDQSIMYCWQFAMMEPDGTITVAMGREWDEFRRMIERIRKESGMAEIVIWVHNLSYEFQFLAGVFRETIENVFALERRKVARATILGCEFRCSYIQSNMSLMEFTNKMGVEMPKASGFDYAKVRYPWTELSADELDYCVRDVVGLVQAMRVQLDTEHDDLISIPMTNTGYVRRDAKRAMQWWSIKGVQKLLPDLHQWELLREAFRGGNTHANRFYVGAILENVKSCDRSSSYPDVLCNCLFPMSRFIREKDNSISHMMELIKKKRRAFVARIRCWGVALSDPFWGCPYLSIDKCRSKKNAINDNGRILSADYLETTITDVDIQIILSEYQIRSMEVVEMYSARYDLLPQPIINLNIEYYEKKTQLKGVDGQEIYYMKSKNKLNSIYGMMAQNPVRRSIIFDGDFKYDCESTDQELLDKYNAHAFLTYAWGVWCTAWARYRLEQGIRIAGHDFVYADTDSVKYIGDHDFSEFNDHRIRDSKASGAWAEDKNGKKYFMGVYDEEHPYDRFITWGAKKYAYEIDGKLGITVAGVGKKAGAKELGAAGGLEAFRPGFIFRDAGGLESVYNDVVDYDEWIDDHKIHISRNVCLRPSSYTLGITDDFDTIIKTARYELEKLENIY